MMKATALHKLVTSVWYGSSAAAILLLPFSLLYWVVIALRRRAYEVGLLARPQLGVPVVVVGNITVGGTGKTPVVAWLATRLRDAGRHPVIVSRGYGGKETAAPLVLDDSTTAAEAGDEPLLLRRLTNCPVVVCRDRVAAVKVALSIGADVVIADDGLQHYKMRRDVEVAVIDGRRRLGNGWLLPAGPLRERAARLAEVDAVLINGADGDGMRFDLSGDMAVSMQDGSRRALHEFSGGVWSVAGIGNPQRFHDSLRAHGIEVHEVDVPDHGVADMDTLRARREMPILMTEKDATKYGLAASVDAWYVPVQLTMAPEDQNVLLDLINRGIGCSAAGTG